MSDAVMKHFCHHHCCYYFVCVIAHTNATTHFTRIFWLRFLSVKLKMCSVDVWFEGWWQLFAQMFFILTGCRCCCCCYFAADLFSIVRFTDEYMRIGLNLLFVRVSKVLIFSHEIFVFKAFDAFELCSCICINLRLFFWRSYQRWKSQVDVFVRVLASINQFTETHTYTFDALKCFRFLWNCCTLMGLQTVRF